MKILHTLASVDPRGGGVVEAIKQGLAAPGMENHTFEVASLDAPGAEYIKNFDAPIYPLGPGLGHYGYSPRFLSWLKAHHHEYDAVIVNGIWQFSSLGVWVALRKTKTPYFVFVHGMLDPWFRRAYPWKHMKKRFYWPCADYRVLRDARAVLYTCEQERMLARESFRSYRCREVVVNLGLGAPPGEALAQKTEFLRCFPQVSGRRVWLCLSRIHEKKGGDILLKAFARLARRDASLLLVMAGPDQTGWCKVLQTQAAQLGISSKVLWTGALFGDLKWGAYRVAEAFVLPSHQENFGLAVVEALACGVPVIISDKVNIWREIAARQAGFVGKDDEAGLTGALERWLALTPDEKKNMQGCAYRAFLECFDASRAAQALIQTIRCFSA